MGADTGVKTKDIVFWDGGQSRWQRNAKRYLIGLKDRGIFQNKKIALIGSWGDQKWIYDTMEKLGLKLSFIADNNPSKQGIVKLGIKTNSVESLLDIEDLIILVSGAYFSEISTQLKSLGYVENKDFFVLALEKGDSLYDDRNQKKFEADVMRGFELYSDIKKRHGDMPIWLMHQISLGDLYLFSLFLPAAMGVSDITECECVLVVARRATKHLAEILGYKNIELVLLEDMSCSLLPLTKIAGDCLNMHNTIFHGTDTLISRIINHSEINFIDTFTKGVFRFSKGVKPIYPHFPKRSERVHEIFQEYGLKFGKTILLSPYATHFTASISDKQWETLAEKLKKKGYSVCTNCAGDEKPVRGTQAPPIELEDCVEFVENAGYFIGVRSGLCDLICMAECSKIIIYEEGANADINFHGFANMGIGKGITELVNDTVHTDEMISEIVSML